MLTSVIMKLREMGRHVTASNFEEQKNEFLLQLEVLKCQI